MSVKRIVLLFAWCSVALGGCILGGCISGVPPQAAESNEYVRCPAGKIEDAEDGDTQILKPEGRGGYWFKSVDTAGSKLDEPQMVMAEGGANGSKHSARMSGTLAKSGASIYAVLGFSIADPKGAYDASQYSGVSFWAKGPGLVDFKVADINTEPMGDRCTDCYNKFGVSIYLSDKWTRYTVPFSAMKQSPGWGDPAPGAASHGLIALEWHVNKPGEKFDFSVDDIEFVGCQSPDQQPRDAEYMGAQLNAEKKADDATEKKDEPKVEQPAPPSEPAPSPEETAAPPAAPTTTPAAEPSPPTAPVAPAQ